MRALLALTLTGSLSACGGGNGVASFGGVTQPDVTTVPGESETSAAGSSSTGPAAGSSTAAAGSSSSSTSTDASSGMVWDMGMPDFGPQQPAGCKGKIDFLFVVSSGGTMQFHQEQLISSLPDFMDALQAQLPDFDYHIISANTDKSWAIEDCSICTEGCDPQGEPPFCSAAVTGCDKKIGAGVIFPTGLYASNRRCDIDSGLRYITTGQQNLDEVFACTAQVGTYGSSIAGQTMVEALKPQINDPENVLACNGGFLREDALLVVTIIQNNYDEDSLGTVDEWIAALRASKQYDDDAFAVLVLTTDIDVDYGQLCDPNLFTMEKNRLRLLAEGVDHGFIDSICRESYVPFFAEHVADIVDLCDDFVVPG